jgi:hypothetical protein
MIKKDSGQARKDSGKRASILKYAITKVAPSEFRQVRPQAMGMNRSAKLI